jgi:hypothetical protein
LLSLKNATTRFGHLDRGALRIEPALKLDEQMTVW